MSRLLFVWRIVLFPILVVGYLLMVLATLMAYGPKSTMAWIRLFPTHVPRN